MQIPKLPLFLFLSLIVFDFSSFEGSKIHLTREAYIYIYICIYWVLLWYFEAINASIQGIICSSMIFHLHASFNNLFFLWTWLFSVLFSIMTSPRYYDVTHFLTDPDEICTVSLYVKLEIKDILFVRTFWFSEYLLRKLRFITKITSIVQLSYTIPFGPPIIDLELGRFIYVREIKRFDPFKFSIYAWCIKIAIAGSLAPVRLAYVPILRVPKKGFIYVEVDTKKLCARL